MYVDVNELIDKKEHSGYGCRRGNKYYSIIIPADDMYLVSPSAYGMQKILTICSSFSDKNALHFIFKKTQCIMFHHKQCVGTNAELYFNGGTLQWSCNITLTDVLASNDVNILGKFVLFNI